MAGAATVNATVAALLLAWAVCAPLGLSWRLSLLSLGNSILAAALIRWLRRGLP